MNSCATRARTAAKAACLPRTTACRNLSSRRFPKSARGAYAASRIAIQAVSREIQAAPSGWPRRPTRSSTILPAPPSITPPGCRRGSPQGVHAMRQINDMPPPPETHVFEHRKHSCPSPNCGKIAKAPFLGDVARPGRYGKTHRGLPILRRPARPTCAVRRYSGGPVQRVDIASRPEASGQDGPAGRRQAPLGHAIFDALPFVLRVYPSRRAMPRRLPQNRGRDHFAPHFSR